MKSLRKYRSVFIVLTMVAVSFTALNLVPGMAHASPSSGACYGWTGYDGNKSFYLVNNNGEPIPDVLPSDTNYSGLQNYSIPGQIYHTLNGVAVDTGGKNITNQYGETKLAEGNFIYESNWHSDYYQISIPIAITGFTKNRFNHSYDYNQTVGENNLSLKVTGFPQVSNYANYNFAPDNSYGANASGVVPKSNNSSSSGYAALALHSAEDLGQFILKDNPYSGIVIDGSNLIGEYAGIVKKPQNTVYHKKTLMDNVSVYQRFAILNGTYHGSFYSNGYYENTFSELFVVTVNVYTPVWQHTGDINITDRNYISLNAGPTTHSLSYPNVQPGAETSLSIPIAPGNLLEGTVVNNGTDQSSNIPVSN